MITASWAALDILQPEYDDGRYVCIRFAQIGARDSRGALFCARSLDSLARRHIRWTAQIFETRDFCTMDKQVTRLEADLFLLHAPSVYDFRERDDMLFAYLSDSDSVNVTSVYEIYPIGFFSIKQRLADSGFSAEIVNVASLMLMHPQLDIKRLLGRLEAPIFGFDLHWMTHCHGSIELASVVKEVHPE